MQAEPDGEALPAGAFEGREAFHAHLQAALAAAARHRWHELMLADADFADWPLGERATVEALQAWAAPGRRLILVARHFKVLEREHARFVRWRQAWGSLIDARTCSGPEAPPVPSAIWTPGWFLRRTDPERGQGVCGTTPQSRTALRERLDECLRQGRPGFAASTLGL